MLHRDVFVRLISFKLKDAKMILSEFCGGTQPEDHCLVISVKSTHSNSAMACFFFFILRKLILISLRASGGETVVLSLQFTWIFLSQTFVVSLELL